MFIPGLLDGLVLAPKSAIGEANVSVSPMRDVLANKLCRLSSMHVHPLTVLPPRVWGAERVTNPHRAGRWMNVTPKIDQIPVSPSKGANSFPAASGRTLAIQPRRQGRPKF